MIGVQATFSTQQPAAAAGGGEAKEKEAETEEQHSFSHLTPLSQVPPRTTAPPQDWPPYEAGSSSYSGRHDGGLLPPVREGGVYEVLIQSVEAAKADSDAYLTKIIQAIGGGWGGDKNEAGGSDAMDVEGEKEEEGDEEGGEGVASGSSDEEEEEERIDVVPKKGKGKEKEKQLVGAGAGGGSGGGSRHGKARGLKKPKI